MNETTLTKNKVALYMAIPLALRGIIELVRGLIYNGLSEGFVDFQQTKQLNLIGNAMNLGTVLITAALMVLFGYLLTKDKRKTVIFTASAFFGIHAASLIASLVQTIITVILDFTANAGSVAASWIIDVVSLLVIIAQVAFATIAFTAIEGINEKFSNTDCSMTLSQARKRYIISYIVAYAVSYVLVNGPVYIRAWLNIGFDSVQMNNIYSAAITVLNWISTVLSFVIVYAFGYKASKNHTDGIKLYSARAFASFLTSIFSAIINTVATALVLFITPVVPAGTTAMDVDPEQFNLRSQILQISYIVNVVVMIAALVIGFVMLKLYFTNNRAAALTEADSEE